MIDKDLVANIISVYVKHGWELRRVLLCEPSVQDIDGITVEKGAIDGLWFARDRSDGDTAWELRHISVAPFALVAVVTEGTDDVEAALDEVEQRMAETLAKQHRGH
ncbi:MAG TPA: hypothetical protein PKA82_13675 [Pyrinomonadaceae bacterium]|nr:hypothetical protein [Pyrinomonadaceae bacterium]